MKRFNARFDGFVPVLTLLVTVLAGTLETNSLCGQTVNVPSGGRARHEFAAAMSKVKVGMSAPEVVELVGQPDEVRFDDAEHEILTTDTREIWRYGVLKGTTVATLGQVYFDTDGLVQYIFGQGAPHTPERLDEQQLRRLLATLAQVPSYQDGYDFNPLPLIQAVNQLQPLGKELALQVLEEWSRVASIWHDRAGYRGAYLVPRVLFDVPADPGFMPELRLGAPAVPQQEDKSILPRFPIAMEDDIPFLVNPGYTLGGRAELPGVQLGYFRKHGTIRAKPLAPTGNPLAAMDRLLASPRSPYTEGDSSSASHEGRNILELQCLRLIDSVHRVEPDRDGELLPWNDKDAVRRKEILRTAANVELRWDPVANQFVRPDGTSLPPRDVKRYRRERWRPEISGRSIEVEVKRSNPQRVDIWISETYKIGQERILIVAQVFDIEALDRPVVQFELVGAGRTMNESRSGNSASVSRQVYLPDGKELRIEIKTGDITLRSPTYKP
jgi:hypothetical protein